MADTDGGNRAVALADVMATVRKQARTLRDGEAADTARLLEEAAESANAIAHHLAGIIERVAEAAAAGRPIEQHVRAFRAAAETAVAAATPPPQGASVMPLRRTPEPRVRALSAVLTAFDLADAGRKRQEVLDYLTSRHPELDGGVLKAIAAITFDSVGDSA